MNGADNSMLNGANNFALKETNKSNETNKGNHDDSFPGKICICQAEYDPDFDSIIGCDNQNCPYIWLHYSCVNIDTVPDGDWFCSSPAFQKSDIN